MKTKILFTVVAMAMLSTVTVSAQKASVENGKIIIDASDMCNTTTVKKALTTLATIDTPVPIDDLNDIASQASNAKIYQKFEISKTDNSNRVTWVEAVNTACAGTINGTTGWRLPTQREFMLISILHSTLKGFATEGFIPLADTNYWSATNMDSSDCWVVYCRKIASSIVEEGKRYSLPVRCIRDVDIP